MNINLVILGGNITRDLELNYTPSATPVLTFGMAVNKRYTDSNGEQRERVVFVDCRAWNKQAEAIAKHFHKGKPICIEGELALEQWEDKETGKKRSKTLVLVNRFHFASDARRRETPEEPEDRRALAPTQRPPAGKEPAHPTVNEQDDDFSF